MKDTVTVRLTVEQLRTISEALWAYEEIELGDKFGNLYGALTDDNDFTDAPDRQSPDWRPGSDTVRESEGAADAQSASATDKAEIKRLVETLDLIEQIFGGKK